MSMTTRAERSRCSRAGLRCLIMARNPLASSVPGTVAQAVGSRNPRAGAVTGTAAAGGDRVQEPEGQTGHVEDAR